MAKEIVLFYWRTGFSINYFGFNTFAMEDCFTSDIVNVELCR